MKTRIKLLGLILIALFIFSACNNDGKDKDIMKIGAILPLTGDLSYLGVPQKNALVLAQEYYNKNANKKIEIIFQDNKGSTSESVSIVNKMINVDMINYFIAFPTAANQAIKPIIESQHGLLFALSFYPPLVENTKNVLRIFYNADSEAQILADIFKSETNPNSNVVIVRSTDAVTEYETKQFLIPRLNKFTKNVFDIPFNVGNRDFKNIIVKARSNNPDAIIILGFGSDFPFILMEINNQFINKPNIYGGIGFLEALDLTKNKYLFDKIKFVIPSFLIESNNNVYKDISQRYKQEFHSSITYDGVYSFDNIGIFSNAINNISSHTTPEELRKYIINLKAYDGIIGKIQILKDGNTYVPQALVEYSKLDNNLRKLSK